MINVSGYLYQYIKNELSDYESLTEYINKNKLYLEMNSNFKETHGIDLIDFDKISAACAYAEFIIYSSKPNDCNSCIYSSKRREQFIQEENSVLDAVDRYIDWINGCQVAGCKLAKEQSDLLNN